MDSITSTAACTYDIPNGFNNVSVLVVAGGGGGGYDAGGGGGGGGVQIRSNLVVSEGDTWNVDIGEGGAGATTNVPGTDGQNSVVSGSGVSITADSGKGGGNCSFNVNYCRRNIGGDPGAGGGQGGTGVFFGYPNRSGQSTQNTITGGDPGSAFQIGTNRLMFGGGGGAASGGGFAANANNGGAGGGGAGGRTGVNASAGSANSGGGGGGGTGNGANGANGIVLFVLQNFGEATSVETECNSGSVSKVQSGREVIITYRTESSSIGDCILTVPTDVYTVDYLVVAGGGGGASGGGGGGGVISSWRTIDVNNSQIAANSSPLTVSPGTDIEVTVGRGGSFGTGGNSLCTGTYTGTCGTTFMPRVSASSGEDSSLGSVTAQGGGRGGQGVSGGGSSNDTNRAFGGGSGGGSGYDISASAANAAPTLVVGARTYGSVGGGSSVSGGYIAGSGGGGGDTCQNDTTTVSNNIGPGCGKSARLIYFNGGSDGNTTGPTSTSGSPSSNGGGGHGGFGIYSNIRSFEGTYAAYGCGGGAGVNNNTNNNGIAWTVWGAGGKAGCYSAGRGSNKSTRFNNLVASPSSASSDFNGSSGVNGFGGGGGGTDPEDMVAGRGGDGVVIVRFTLPDPRCPNDDSDTTVAPPVACIAKLRITAGDSAASTQATRTSDVAKSPISFSNDSTTVSIITSVTGLTTEVVNNKILATVTSRTSSLIGGTYAVTYRLTNETVTSTSYLLVTVRDPDQHTQLRVPVDPRDKTVRIPRIVLGKVQAVQLCVSPQVNVNIPDTPTVVLARNPGGTTSDSPSGNNLRMQGTSESITANIGLIELTTTQTRLLRNGASLTLDINVSNTNTGGNGACDFGTDSTMTLYPIKLIQTRSFVVPLKNGRQSG